MSSIRSRRLKRLNSQSKEIVLNVHEFMTREAQEAKNTVFTKARFLKVLERTSKSSKVSRPTISKILTEGDEAKTVGNASGPTFRTPKSGRLKRRYGLKRDDFTYQLIRRTVYDFRLADNKVLTVGALSNKLKNDVGFNVCTATLSMLLKELGFKFKKNGTNRKEFLVEKNKVRLQRIKFLKQIKKYRNEGRDIVYGDVICVHSTQNKGVWLDKVSKGIKKREIAKGPRLVLAYAGSAKGFLPNALLVKGDCQSEMNKDNYEKWLREKLIPNLQPNSVFVTDNTCYRSTIEEKIPNSKSSKQTMLNWLASKNLDFNSQSFKPELYEIIKNYRESHTKYTLDSLMESHGHKVLILPSYLPDFNPLENIWCKIKGQIESFWSKIKGDLIGKYITALNQTDVQRLTEIFAALRPEDWKKAVEQAIISEDVFKTLEDAMDDRLDQLTAEVENDEWNSDDSSSSSDSSGDSDVISDAEEPFASVFIKD